MPLRPLGAVQYPLDFYPPFASGCGFVLSWDLVRELVKQPLPDYRLLVGLRHVHACLLCGGASAWMFARMLPLSRGKRLKLLAFFAHKCPHLLLSCWCA